MQKKKNKSEKKLKKLLQRHSEKKQKQRRYKDCKNSLPKRKQRLKRPLQKLKRKELRLKKLRLNDRDFYKKLPRLPKLRGSGLSKKSLRDKDWQKKQKN